MTECWALFQYPIKRLLQDLAQSRSHEIFVFRIVRSLWNLTETLAALLSTCLSNFKAIRTFQHSISRLRDFARHHDKTPHPAGTQRNNNVFTTSKRRRRRRVDVVKTLSLRYYCVMCPLGSETEKGPRSIALSTQNLRHRCPFGGDSSHTPEFSNRIWLADSR